MIFWAPGDAGYDLANSIYNYWTANGTPTPVENPATISLPLIETPELTIKSQILPSVGTRDASSYLGNTGLSGYYWSATPGNSTIGYSVNININNIRPIRNELSFSAGMSIRCVRP